MRSFVVRHLKDAFTLINLASGVVAIHYLFSGDPRAAGFSIVAGYVVGDLPDGAVARLTHTSDRFGSEFDSVVDHFVHVIAAGLILYVVYRRFDHEAIGLVVFGVLVATATIRHARFAAAKFDYPYCWCGLPRTISGFAAMSLALSRVFEQHAGSLYWIGAALVVLLSLLNLAPIPYMTHRGARAMQPWVKAGMLALLALPAAALLVARRYFFDAAFVSVMLYSLGGWIPVKPEERKGFRVAYERWSASLLN